MAKLLDPKTFDVAFLQGDSGFPDLSTAQARFCVAEKNHDVKVWMSTHIMFHSMELVVVSESVDAALRASLVESMAPILC